MHSSNVPAECNAIDTVKGNSCVVKGLPFIKWLDSLDSNRRYLYTIMAAV